MGKSSRNRQTVSSRESVSHEARRVRAKARRRRAVGLRAAMLLVLTVVCILFISLFVKGQRLKSEIAANDEREQALSSQIAAEESRTSDIESLKDYYNSEAYIRQEARDRFGLVDDGEIVFRSED